MIYLYFRVMPLKVNIYLVLLYWTKYILIYDLLFSLYIRLEYKVYIDKMSIEK